MPEDSSGGEKTEEPTPKKIRDARMEGQVAFSQEVQTAALLIVGVSAMFVIGPHLYQALLASLQWVLRDAVLLELDQQSFLMQAWSLMTRIGLWVLILMVVVFITALSMGIFQVGLVFTGKPLMPKMSRISPISGFKRIFGMRGLMKFIFSVLKLGIIVSIAWYVIVTHIFGRILMKMDIEEVFADKVWTLFLLALVLACVLVIIAFFDYLYQRWQHSKDIRMTKKEVKDEMKQTDGNPEVKGRIRRLQQEMAQKRMMQEVPKADVVITNPTHVAVALRYDAETMAAPVVVAKGYDDVAQRIKAIAREHDITMVEDVPLARALARAVEVGHPIPGEFYQGVAQVLSHVYRLEGKQQPQQQPQPVG